MLKMFELSPIDGRQSFYGKAKVLLLCNKDTDHYAVYKLFSYDTPIAEYDSDRGTLTLLWNGYSATTMRHYRAFLHFCRIDLCKYGTKAFWNTTSRYNPIFLYK